MVDVIPREQDSDELGSQVYNFHRSHYSFKMYLG